MRTHIEPECTTRPAHEYADKLVPQEHFFLILLCVSSYHYICVLNADKPVPQEHVSGTDAHEGWEHLARFAVEEDGTDLMLLEADVVLGTLLILSLDSLQPRELRELALRACKQSVSVSTFVPVKPQQT